MDISYWRSRIDEVDAKIAALLNERSRYVIEIGKIKRANNMKLFDPEREAQVLRNVIANNRGPLDDDALRRLFERIIDESRHIERLAIEGRISAD